MKRSFLLILPCIALLTGCGSKTGDGQNSLSEAFQSGIQQGMGENFLRVKQYKLAEQSFKKALDLAKRGEDKASIACVWGKLGETYYGMGDNDAAIKAFETANELYEDEASGFMFSVDRRDWKNCLIAYVPVLKSAGKKTEAAVVEEKIKNLREKLGPMEKLREATEKFGI